MSGQVNQSVVVSRPQSNVSARGTTSAAVSPYNKTSDVFSPEYKANTSRRIGFSADVITNTSSNIRLYTAFAMHIVGICPNITQFTVLTY